MTILKKAMALAEKADSGTSSTILLDIAEHQFYTGRIDSADFYTKQAEKVFRRLTRKDSLAAVLKSDLINTKAMVAYGKGDVKTCIRHLLENARLVDSIGDNLTAALVKANISVNYASIEDFRSAIRYNLLAYKELEQLGKLDHPAVPMISANMARSYSMLNDSVQATNWAEKAIKTGKRSGNVRAAIDGRIVLAAQLKAKDRHRAFRYADEALAMAIDAKLPKHVADATLIKAGIYRINKQYAPASRLYDQAIDTLKRLGYAREYQYHLNTAAEVAYFSGNYKKAADYLHESLDLNDSMRIAESDRLARELTVRYETEKKEKLLAEKEVRIQKQRNQLQLAVGAALLLLIAGAGFWGYGRRLTRLRLQKLEQEKEHATLEALFSGEEKERNRISHELHDGVATMLGAVKMQVETLPHLPPDKQKQHAEKVGKLLDGIHGDIRNMAHDLLPVTLEQEGLVKATEAFSRGLNESGAVSVSVTWEENLTWHYSKKEQLIILRMIQELAGNALKHGKAENIVIDFTRAGNDLRISVKDNGKGFDPKNATDGHGLQSIRKRMELVGGSLEISRNDSGSGTTATLTFHS